MRLGPHPRKKSSRSLEGKTDKSVVNLLYNVIGTVSCGNRKEEAMNLSPKLLAYIRALVCFSSC